MPIFKYLILQMVAASSSTSGAVLMHFNQEHPHVFPVETEGGVKVYQTTFL